MNPTETNALRVAVSTGLGYFDWQLSFRFWPPRFAADFDCGVGTPPADETTPDEGSNGENVETSNDFPQVEMVSTDSL